MDDIRFDEMTMADATEVVSLISKAMNWHEAVSADNTFIFYFLCKAHDINNLFHYFVARKDKEIVGVTGMVHYLWGAPDAVRLAWFAVLPEYQKQGIGRWLMDKTVEMSKKLGFCQLLAETYSDDRFARARRFYERYGFEYAGKITNYPKKNVDMLVYRLDL
jgi:ribosomal protein S18 acetylase RimI-like enzyme